MSTFFSNKTILLPFDFSDESKAALGEALQMADASTTLHMVNVIIPASTLALEPAMTVELGDDNVRMDVARGKMAELVGDCGRPVQCETRLGDPGHEIVDFANEINADLIVMPSHGRSGIRRILLGSVAERVMRHAECPVMIIRKPKG